MVALVQQRSTTPAQLPSLLVAGALIAGLLSVQAVDDSSAIQGFWRGLVYYLFWLCHTLVGLLLMSGVTRVLSRRLPAIFTDWADWLQLLCAGVIGALCFAPIAGLLEYTFAALGIGDSDAKEFSELLAPGLINDEFFELLLPFVASWLLLNLSYQSLQSSRPAAVLPLSDESLMMR